MDSWEYAQLRLTCDPGADTDKIWAYLVMPGETKWRELGVVPSLFGKINELGRDGWEMVGPPSSVNAVFSYKAGNDTWHDRAYFVEKDYWFKRKVGS